MASTGRHRYYAGHTGSQLLATVLVKMAASVVGRSPGGIHTDYAWWSLRADVRGNQSLGRLSVNPAIDGRGSFHGPAAGRADCAWTAVQTEGHSRLLRFLR